MDVPSQDKFIQDNNSVSTGQDLTKINQEVNSMHTGDEKVLTNNGTVGNHKSSIELLNGSPSLELEDHTGTNSRRRQFASKQDHAIEDIQSLVCSNGEQFEATPGTETNKLSQPSNRKRGRPQRKREISFTGTPRVLRTRSQEKPKVPDLVNAPRQDAVRNKEKKRRKTIKIEKNHDDEFSKIRKHLRYLLSRMSYEQNFIEAYAGEGWKGQSLEKLRPEKELERAKSDINRYKLKIRDLFQRIDRSFEEGRFPESVYDSDGLIDSEDIFCAKCGQAEVRLDNDIILCDGACDRGFHQFCLEPPLLKEQVPPDDEGWLCPACDCKVDCLDLLNDSQGTDLSINDDWEKVFPETVSTGNKLDDILGLPSDDSGDDDYNPDGPEVEEEVDGEESVSDESDFSSASEDLPAVAQNEQYLGLPSDDSEDDDFNPDKADSDEHAKTKSSSSDFTSDSEDLDDVSKNEGILAEEQAMSEDGEELPKANTENDDSGPITAKRRVERLDYKKLHDETYANASSDSSDDDFFDTNAPRRRKNNKGAKANESNQTESTPDDFGPITAKRRVERLDYKKLHDETYGNVSSDSSDDDFLDTNGPKRRKNNKGENANESNQTESTPVKKTSKKVDVEGTSTARARKGSSAEPSDKSGTNSACRRLGEAATKRLYEAFQENHYPDQDVREQLVQELNLTHMQVRKWFENARWSFNHSGERTNTVNAENVVEKKRRPAKSITASPLKSKAYPVAKSNQSARRSTRIQAKRE